MTLQQLEYVVAVDTHRNFGKAAKACFVTQPTLSMMIQKMEKGLNVVIFDRTKKPVVPTTVGSEIIEQARVLLQEKNKLLAVIKDSNAVIKGSLSIGIIPTLAPYLIPIFIKSFLEKYSDVELTIEEFKTDDIIFHLKKGIIDIGILATPISESSLTATPIFHEEFFLYSKSKINKKYVLAEDINPNDLWLLEEGHCLRSQIVNICELRKKQNRRLEYQAGSLETLKSLVKTHHGVTILPELATINLPKKEKEMLHRFRSPQPVREISIVQHRNVAKSRIIRALEEEIKKRVNQIIPPKKKFTLIDIQPKGFLL